MSKGLALISPHHNFASHLRVNRAEVGEGPRFGKLVRKLLVGIQDLGLKCTVGAVNRMGNIIPVSPGNSSSGGHRKRRRSKAEIIYLHLRGCRRRLVAVGYGSR